MSALFLEAPRVVYANRGPGRRTPSRLKIRSGGATSPTGAARRRWLKSAHATGGRGEAESRAGSRAVA